MSFMLPWVMLTSLLCWGKELSTASSAQGPSRQLADRKVILGLRTIREGHWDRGVGTEGAEVRALAPEAVCLACGDSTPGVMVWESTDAARLQCHPKACQPNHEISEAPHRLKTVTSSKGCLRL